MASIDTRLEIPEHEAQAPPARLPRHRYPWPIVAAGLVVILAAVYSFTLAPGVVAASNDLNAGRDALARGDYATALVKLHTAYQDDPGSHKVQLAYAEAAFGGGQPRTAMRVLVGVKLTNNEFTELEKYMPAAYQKYFDTVS